jgi:hypothetical protein
MCNPINAIGITTGKIARMIPRRALLAQAHCTGPTSRPKKIM